MKKKWKKFLLAGVACLAGAGIFFLSTYERPSLLILDPVSHPQQGENWEVAFITTGTADLRIVPIDQATIDDDEFVSLTCGGEVRIPQMVSGDGMYYPGWSCSKEGKVVHYTKKAGKHNVQFEFGGQIAYAHNNPDVETLRPNGAGSETNLGSQFPDSTFHWDKVDEEVADDDTTYVAPGSPDFGARDLYALPAHTGSGSINSVTVYGRMKKSGGGGVSGWVSIRTNSTTYDVSVGALTTSYANYSNTWTANPATDLAWTWDDIDSLEAGIYMYNSFSGSATATQVYVEVDYILPTVEILRPDGAGDLTQFTPSGCASNFECIDEEAADGDTTYVSKTIEALTNFYIVLKENGVTTTALKSLGAVYGDFSQAWTTKPSNSGSWSIADINSLQIGVQADTSVDVYNIFVSSIAIGSTFNSLSVYVNAKYVAGGPVQHDRVTQVYAVVDYTPPVVTSPTITLDAATSVESTTAIVNGDVTDTGYENPTVTMYWGTADGGQIPGSWTNSSAPTSPTQPQGVAAFYTDLASLSPGTTYYFSAKATNSAGTSWPAASLSFLTKPAAPTSVAATDGTDTDKVTVTWAQSTGATGYKVYEGTNLLDTLGDVATYDDTAASAPTITPGSTVATDGSVAAHTALSLSGASANVGATRTYKVVAFNGTGDSADSATDTGYRGVGTLTYQWQRSAGDSDANYSNIDGATASTYNDTSAPAYAVNAPTAVAVTAQSSSVLRVTFSGASITDGAGRYYKCLLDATGAAQQLSTSNRGYRDDALAPTDGYEVFSDTSAGGAYATSEGTTDTSPFDDTGLSANTRKYYKVRARSVAGTWSTLSTAYDGEYTLANTKAIIAFAVPGQTGSTTINETVHTIALTVPYGTAVTALVPTITITGASVSPASGVARNFTAPQTYTVTAEDASTQAYLVTVTVSPPSTTLVTLKPKSGAVKIKVGSLTKTLKPFGTTYKGGLWAKQIKYSRTHSHYVVIPTSAYSKGSIRYYNEKGKITQTVKLSGLYAPLGMTAAMVLQPSNNKVYLAVAFKKTGYTVRIYEVTKTRLVSVSNVSALKKTSPGTIILGFLKLYSDDYGLTTLKSGAKTWKTWKYSSAKRKWLQDTRPSTKAKLKVSNNKVVLR